MTASLSEKQLQILAFPYTKYEALICDGAVRSGKTSIMTVAFIDWAMREFNNENFALAGKTVGSCTRNVVKPYKSLHYTKTKYKITHKRSENLLIISNGKHTNHFYLFGGKDERSQDLIQGITLAGLFLDEVALMPRSFVEQALARCSVEKSRLWFNCNPEHPEHYFNKEWILEAKKQNALHLHFLMTDNPSLSKETLEKYERRYTGVFHDRYIKGLWVKAEGLIYEDFAQNADKYIISNVDRVDRIVIGLDYGASVSNTSFKAVALNDNFKDVVIIEEKDLTNIKTPEMIYRHFEDFVNLIQSKYQTRSIEVFADWGGLGDVITHGLISYCRTKNIKVNIRNAEKGTILDRIQLTGNLMAQGRLKVSNNCPNMSMAFRNAVWDEKKIDTRLDDGTSDVDSLDAFEYAIYPFRDYLIKRR